MLKPLYVKNGDRQRSALTASSLQVFEKSKFPKISRFVTGETPKKHLLHCFNVAILRRMGVKVLIFCILGLNKLSCVLRREG